MGTYAQTTDVAARLPGRALSSTSKPSTGDVTLWIAEAEGELEAELIAQGLSVPIIDARGILVMRAKVTSYAIGRWKAGVVLGTNLQDTAAKPPELQEYDDFRTLIRHEISRAATMLGQGAGSSGGARLARSYATDNKDGKSISDGDFDPVFSRDQKW